MPLRFAYVDPDSEEFIKEMDKQVDFDKIWFKEPVICCPYGAEYLDYKKGSCKISEEVSKNIINLPVVLTQDWQERLG